jgi:hypothetical protein
VPPTRSACAGRSDAQRACADPTYASVRGIAMSLVLWRASAQSRLRRQKRADGALPPRATGPESERMPPARSGS